MSTPQAISTAEVWYIPGARSKGIFPMKNRSWTFLTLLITAALLAAGCASRYERVQSARPDGGVVRIINKPKSTVFAAAVLAMHERGEELWEAQSATGKIVSLTTFGKRAIFILAVSERRTRVELSSNFSRALIPGTSNSGKEFFTLLREQIFIYEKKAVFKNAQKRKWEVDNDLRTVYKPESEAEKKSPNRQNSNRRQRQAGSTG